MLPIIDKFKNSLSNQAGKHDVDSATMWTTPWTYRSDDGLYIGHDGSGWLYREMPLKPLVHENDNAKLDACTALDSLLYDLDELGGVDNSQGISLFDKEREVHVMAVTWETKATPSGGVTEELAHWQADALGPFNQPNKALLVGVRLTEDSAVDLSKGLKGIARDLFGAGEKALGETGPNAEKFSIDYAAVNDLFVHHGCTAPSRPAMRQLECWYSDGETTDALIEVREDDMYVKHQTMGETVQMWAVHSFDRENLRAPQDMWAMTAAATPDKAPKVISIRASLQSNSVARNRLRRTRRKQRNQASEMAMSNDLGRAEDDNAMASSERAENIVTGPGAILTNCSIVMATVGLGPDAGKAQQLLKDNYEIDLQPLVLRQLEGLEETLPCSNVRSHPHLQDLTIPMISYAGLQAFSQFGDKTGVLIGLADPDLVPVFLDPIGDNSAPANNKPATMLVAGSSGSGKTFFLQYLATQAVKNGTRTIFVNPKNDDNLDNLTQYLGADVAETVNMRQLETGPSGRFDPFHWATENPAAIAFQFLRTAFGKELTTEEQVELKAGLDDGASRGARSTMAALKFVPNPKIRSLAKKLHKSDTMFRLGVADSPRQSVEDAGQKMFTLIQWNKALSFPRRGQEPEDLDQCITLAIMQLQFAFSTEMLIAQGGGMLVFDEAWTLLQTDFGLDMLQRMGRLGRSQGVLPVLATQRVSDVLRDGVDMEEHLSRVLVMKLQEERDQRAALKLCGIEDTDENLKLLADFGMRKPSDPGGFAPSRAFHRDLNGNHSVVHIAAALPDAAADAYNTNPNTKKEAQG